MRVRTAQLRGAIGQRVGRIGLVLLLGAAACCARAQAPAAPLVSAPVPGPVQPEDAVVLIRTANSLRSARGSGFLIGDGSWVVTASHVVAADLGKNRRASDRTALVYSPWTGRPYEARVVAVDGAADIALLRLPQGGLPALPAEGLELKDAAAARSALESRPLRLYGFPLSYGEDTVAALARPEHNTSRLREINRRGATSLCVLGACPDAKPGWSGGPMVSGDRGTVVAVFHSLFVPRDAAPGVGYPAGSVCGYLGDLLKQAGAGDLAPFGRGAVPAAPRPARAAERMALEMRSLAWSAGGNWKKAEEEQREVLKLAPDDGLTHAELARLLLEQERWDDALKHAREAVRLSPTSALAQFYLGRTLHLTFDPRGAAAAFARALVLSPGEVEPQLALAQVQDAGGRPEEAEATLRAALAGAASHPGVLYRLGALLVRQKREADGLKLLSQAAELALSDPGLSNIALAYARTLDTARKNKEAEDAYRQVVRVDPENAHARYYLALLYYRTSRFEDAQIALNAGIVLPHLSEAMVQAFRALQLKVNEKASGM